MDGILEWFGSFAAAGIMLAISIGGFVGAFAAGRYVAIITKRNWAGWLTGVATFALIVVIMEPSYTALKRVTCHGSDDFQSCMDEDGGDD